MERSYVRSTQTSPFCVLEQDLVLVYTSVTYSRVSDASMRTSVCSSDLCTAFAATYLYLCGVSLSYVWRIYVRVADVWRMKRTRDVSTAYALFSILIKIYGVSVAYPWC